MRLCWHKWIVQNNTPKLTAYASTIGIISALLFFLNFGLMFISDEWRSIFIGGAVVTGAIGLGLLVTSETRTTASGQLEWADRELTLWTINDRVCAKCGKSKLDFTNQQMADKRAKERLELYTKTLRDINDGTP